MTYVLILLALLGALGAILLLVRARAAVPAPVRPLVRATLQPARAASTVPPAASPAGSGSAAPAVSAEPLPAALADFQWAEPDRLDAERRQALVAAIRSIPRPPGALHQLLSPQFVERASSAELSDLIAGEAQIAAKVLATVNAPYYGLKQPVGNIGQAVTFLGLNTVRGICLRYLLDDAFKPRHAGLKQAYDRIWAASALASELCSGLSQKLSLPDHGSLEAQVLLSFLGHLATASLLLQQPGAQPLPDDLLSRMRRGQDELGLGAGEIGGLLLREWGLPASIVDEVLGIDRILVTPVGALPAPRSQRLALAYLCARLGERLARTEGAQAMVLSSFDAANEPGDDFFHLHGHLATPALARIGAHLGAADLARALHPLQQAMLDRH